MRYSILFIAVLILVSGFIAYFGDLLGRWLGKKRLTLGSLRPRHTAYAVTALTGMIISGMVLATLFTAYPEFRKAFTRWEQILAENKSLTTSNHLLAETNTQLLVRGRKLRAQAEKLRLQADSARREAEKARAERDRQLKMVGRLEREVAVRTREIAARRKQLDALQGQVGHLREDVALAQADIKVKAEELERVQSSLSKAQADLRSADARLADAEKSLAKTNKELENAKRIFAEQQDAINQQREMITEQLARIKDMGKQNLQFQTEALRFQTESETLRAGKVVLRQGDEITRAVVSPRQSLFGIRADVVRLLESAGDTARQAGAVLGDNGRAVKLFFRQSVDNEYFIYNDNETINIQRAAESISQSVDAVLVQVICARNTVQGEQAQVEIQLYRNKLVYQKGDLIAHTTMDGRASEGRILLAIIRFLQDDVSRAGLEKGIVPIGNPDSRVSSSANPRAQVEGLMNAVDQVASKNAKVTVNVYACADIHAAGPLNMTNMRFSVAKTE